MAFRKFLNLERAMKTELIPRTSSDDDCINNNNCYGEAELRINGFAFGATISKYRYIWCTGVSG
jgi:hypothetical protein